MAKHKCRMTKTGKVTPCDTLADTVQGCKGGIEARWSFFEVKACRRTIGWVYVLTSGKFRKNGVVLNYCPFCGEAIYKDRG